MIDKRCLLCDFYDPDYECTLPTGHEYACLLSKDNFTNDTNEVNIQICYQDEED